MKLEIRQVAGFNPEKRGRHTDVFTAEVAKSIYNTDDGRSVSVNYERESAINGQKPGDVLTVTTSWIGQPLGVTVTNGHGIYLQGTAYYDAEFKPIYRGRPDEEGSLYPAGEIPAPTGKHTSVTVVVTSAELMRLKEGVI